MDDTLYKKLLERHGDSPRTLDWSPEGQRARFRVLHEVGISTRSTVLDVGCGLAHFRAYLRECGFGGSYVGLDASESLIKQASEREQNDRFLIGNALKPLPERAAYVVSSGVVNVENGHNDHDALALLQNCFEAATIGCAVNFISSRAEKRNPERHYFHPQAWLKNAFDLSSKVVLRHDYRLNDFTLYLYR